VVLYHLLDSGKIFLTFIRDTISEQETILLLKKIALFKNGAFGNY